MRFKGAVMTQTSVDDLAERISVVYYETARDNRGNIIKSNEVVRCTVWAKVLPLTGKINDSTPERVNTVTYRINIRYRTDILPDDEIVWRGRRFKIITAPIDLEVRHIWLQFDCVEVVQDGKAKSGIV